MSIICDDNYFINNFFQEDEGEYSEFYDLEDPQTKRNSELLNSLLAMPMNIHRSGK